MNIIKLVLPAVLALTIPTVSATSHDATNEVFISELSHISGSPNSGTMKSARKFCALVVHAKHVEKKITDLMLVDLVGECAMGNMNHVLHELGAHHSGPEDALHSIQPIEGGVRHISRWEADAMSARHKIEGSFINKEEAQ